MTRQRWPRLLELEEVGADLRLALLASTPHPAPPPPRLPGRPPRARWLPTEVRLIYGRGTDGTWYGAMLYRWVSICQLPSQVRGGVLGRLWYSLFGGGELVDEPSGVVWGASRPGWESDRFIPKLL